MKRTSEISLILQVLFLITVIPISAHAVDGQIKISQTASTTFPIWINVSGSYVLTSNIVINSGVSAGILINTDNVTLDLNGHSIIGPGGDYGEGIFAHDRNDIIIMNGTIQNFGNGGIRLDSSTSSSDKGIQIKNITVSHNGGTGITAWGPSLLINCTALSNGSGGIFTSGGGGRIINCHASGNASNGISTSNSSITDSISNSNGTSGFYCSRHCSITNSTANSNTTGFEASKSTLINCSANENTSYGFDIEKSVANNCEADGSNSGSSTNGFKAEKSTITNCTATECALNGIDATSQTTILNFTAIGNGSNGIHILDGCRIEGCNLSGNGWGGSGYGIFISGSHNYAIKNASRNNTSGNFHTDNPANNYMPTSLTAPDAANTNVGW